MSPLVITIPPVKPGKRGPVVARLSVRLALELQGMLSPPRPTTLMWVVAALSWLEFEVNWVSMLVLTLQTAALLGNQLVAENLTAEVVPQVFGAGTWRDSPLAPVTMARQLMVLFQEQMRRDSPFVPVLKV